MNVLENSIIKNNNFDSGIDALIFLIIGPTGVGKNTLINGLFNKRKDLHYLPSFTTREMKRGESEGNPYKFVSQEKFKNMIRADEFIEWNIVQGGNFYGVSKEYIREQLSNKISVVTDVDVLGAMDIIEHFPRETVSIFITLSDIEELERRVRNRNRGEKDEEIKKRLLRAKMEFSYKRHFEYIIVNDVVKDAVTELGTIVDFEMENMKTREIYEKPDFLHYYVNLFLSADNKVLLRQKKGEPQESKWELPGRHILRNETPNKALSRMLRRTINDIQTLYPGIIEWANFAIPITFKHGEVKGTHWHYEMNFRYAAYKIKELEGPNHIYEWKDSSYLDIKNYL